MTLLEIKQINRKTYLNLEREDKLRYVITKHAGIKVGLIYRDEEGFKFNATNNLTESDLFNASKIMRYCKFRMDSFSHEKALKMVFEEGVLI